METWYIAEYIIGSCLCHAVVLASALLNLYSFSGHLGNYLKLATQVGSCMLRMHTCVETCLFKMYSWQILQKCLYCNINLTYNEFGFTASTFLLLQSEEINV